MANKILFTDSYIQITCDRGDVDTIQRLRQIPVVHSNRIGTIHMVSARLVPEVLKVFRSVDKQNIDAAPHAVQERYWQEMQRREVTDALRQFGSSNDRHVTPTLTLMPHQQLARELAQQRSRFGFFYDTRTGKTPLSLAIIRDDATKHPDHKWLVVCPLILIENAWIEDAKMFVPDLKVVNCHASTKAKRLQAMQQQGNIYVTNTESFVSYVEYFGQMNFHGCIVDESSDMKSSKSKQSQALVEFSQKMKRWYLLSGSPAPNNEQEYYMQLKSIDYYGIHRSKSAFLEYFFTNISYNSNFPKYAMRPDKQDEFNALLRRYSIYVDKEDVLTTPGRTFEEVEIDMPDEVAQAYRKMKNELCVELQDNLVVTAPSAAAKLNKLNQITSGFIMDTQARKENELLGTNKQEWYLLNDYRFNKLCSLLDNIGHDEQVLIWANYRIEFDKIKELLGDKCRCVYGGTSLEEKNEAIRLFKNKQLQYLVANPASADKGLTLTNCHICIYFSLNWSYETYKQSMERIYADISKQPKHCYYYILIAKHTIDSVLYKDVLQGKADASYAVLNHLKGVVIDENKNSKSD